MLQVPVMQRCPSGGSEMQADGSARQGTDRHRRERRTVGGRAKDIQRHAASRGENAQPVVVTALALIGGHAECGIALEMLGRLESVLEREIQVSDRHIALKIDEGFRVGRNRLTRLRHHQGRRAESDLARLARLADCATQTCSLLSDAMRFHQRSTHMNAECGIKYRPNTGMGRQLDGGHPATRHGDQITRQPFASTVTVRLYLQRTHPTTSDRLLRQRGESHGHVALTRLFQPMSVDRLATINNGDVRTGFSQLHGRAPGRILHRHHGNRFTQTNAIAIEVHAY